MNGRQLAAKYYNFVGRYYERFLQVGLFFVVCTSAYALYLTLAI